MTTPVARTCCCPTRPRAPGEHTAQCNAAYKAKFLAAVASVRDGFYGRSS